MTQRTVSDAASLTAALKASAGGDVILLAPGTYSSLVWDGLSFSPEVKIASADLSKLASLTNFLLTNCRGITFEDLDLAAQPVNGSTNVFGFVVKFSDRIAFNRVAVHGFLDQIPDNDASGIQVLNSSNISVTNSTFEECGRGAAFGTVANLIVANNYVHSMRSDGFDFAAVSFVRVVDNIIHTFNPVTGDHPDAIQFWTQGTTTASHDILISGNLILKGEGTGGSQGIFMGDEVGTLPFLRLTISDNFLGATGINALRLYGTDGAQVLGNTLLTLTTDANPTGILLQKSINAVIQNNITCTAIGCVGPTGVADPNNITSPNTLVAKVTAEQLAAKIADWKTTHAVGPQTTPAPTPEPTPEPAPEPTPTPAPDPRIAELEAALEQATADLLATNDTITARDARITAFVTRDANALDLAKQIEALGLQARKARSKNQYIDQINTLAPQLVTLLSAAI